MVIRGSGHCTENRFGIFGGQVWSKIRFSTSFPFVMSTFWYQYFLFIVLWSAIKIWNITFSPFWTQTLKRRSYFTQKITRCPALGLSYFRWSAVGTCLGNSGQGWILFLSRSNYLNDWWKICMGRRQDRVLGCCRLRIFFIGQSCRTLSSWTESCSTCLFGWGFRSLCTGLGPVAEMMEKLHFYLFTKGLHTCSWWSNLFWTWKTRHTCLGLGW